MYTEKERKELIKIFDELKVDVQEILEQDESLPNYVTHNSDTVGITVKFRKLYPKLNDWSLTPLGGKFHV